MARKSNGGKRGQRSVLEIYYGDDITVITILHDGNGVIYKSRLWAEVMVNEGRAKWLGDNVIKMLYTRKQVLNFVMKRDNYVCQYCYKEGNTVDHIQPYREGGLDTPENLVCCCERCNTVKANIYFKKDTKRESFELAKNYLQEIIKKSDI
jgi:hypothetical protein